MFATLGEREFRLISLAPATQQDAIISIELSNYNIDSAPVYDAVSYVWGDQRQKIDISCNYQLFPVSTNLHWALKRIRHGYEPRILWADAICINQENVDERSVQVSMMGTIYSTARHVYLCMGEPSSPGGDLDVATLINGISMLWGPHNFGMKLSDNDPLFCDRRWNSFRELMSCPWFRRTWVIQEAGLARNPRVLYGNNEFGYREMLKVIEWWNSQRKWGSEYSQLPSLLIHREWCNWRTDLSQNHQRAYTFIDLLNHGVLLDCGDARDYVYAFMGHALAMIPDTAEPLVVPDYNKTTSEVFLDVSCTLLRHFGLRLLSSVEHTNRTIVENDLPSWVVRWDVSLVFNDISWSHYSNYWATPAAWAPDRSTMIHEAKTLILPGVILDKIRDSWDASPDNGQYTGTGPPTVFLDKTARHDKDFEKAVEHLRQNRRAFQTFRGILGIGPSITEPGDVVALIFGTDVPFVLRPVYGGGTSYKLLGDAYVRGYMRGEIEIMLRYKPEKTEMIRII